MAAIRRASSREALEIKYRHWGSQEESDFWERFMRLFVITLGLFAAIVCIEEPADAQNGAWCIYKPDTPGQCRYATFEQCLADRLGKGGSCGPSPYSVASPEPRPSTRPQRR